MSDKPPEITQDERGRWLITLEEGVGLSIWKEANAGWCVSMLSDRDVHANVRVGDQTLRVH